MCHGNRLVGEFVVGTGFYEEEAPEEQAEDAIEQNACDDSFPLLSYDKGYVYVWRSLSLSPQMSLSAILCFDSH